MTALASGDGLAPAPTQRSTLAALVLLAVLALAAIAPALFSAEPLVPARYTTDLNHQFRHWHAFAAREIMQGNLPLWNPHVYGGQSYIGSFQSALFYPLNALFVALPLRWAINAFLLVHLVIAGWGMFGWSRSRGLTLWPSVLAGAMFMLAAPLYLRLQAGHMTVLAAGAWLPLVFWSIDRMLDRPVATWVIIGSAAASLMLLAGHPQTAYYAAIAAAIYVPLRLIRAPRRMTSIGALALTALIAALIGSVQILPGIESAAEGLRAGGLDAKTAATFSLPPENLLTMVSPTLLGDAQAATYWGRWYYWEMSLYVGVAGASLAMLGALFGNARQRRFAGVMVIVLIVLALGAHTPMFDLLRQWLPGFDRFRGTAKFSLEAALFLAMLGGVGAQRLLDGPGPPRLAVILLGSVALLCAVGGALVREAVSDPQIAAWWVNLVHAMAQTQQSYVPDAVYADPGFMRSAGTHAALSLLASSALLAAVALLFAVARRWRRAARWVAGAAILELLLFAYLSTVTLSLDQGWPRELEAVMQRQPRDARVLNLKQPNVAMTFDSLDVWGYDPTVSRRYAELIAFTQGVDPDDADYAVNFHNPHPLLAMLRCHEIIGYKPDQSLQLRKLANPLPRVLLVRRHRVIEDRDDRLAAMGEASFDPRREVILESQPRPRPAGLNVQEGETEVDAERDTEFDAEPGAEVDAEPDAEAVAITTSTTGRVRVLDESTDHLTIEAELDEPAILLVTDNFASGWGAVALEGSVQDEYEVMVANHVLRAVPLKAGFHRLRMTYEPRTWLAARVLGGVGVALWLALATLRLVVLYRQRRSANKAA